MSAVTGVRFFWFLEMPYKVLRRENEYCVYKLDASGKPISLVKGGCHGTREEADRHRRALYASENKEVLGGELVKSKPLTSSFAVYKDKETDRMRWLAQYSNNIRDDDDPPEILSAESHRRFVYMVDKGIVPYPELWLWHIKEWAIGTSDWLAVDEKGPIVFAVASGYFYDHAKEVAVALAGIEDIALSHGMYPDLIERGDADPTVITGYVDREITLLPRWSAANKFTAYATHTTES